MSRDERKEHLSRTVAALVKAAEKGLLDKGKPIEILQADYIRAPRAGAIELYAGLDTGRLLRILSADNGAVTRQFIGWDFPGDPQVFISGRAVRLEAGWPDSLATKDIPLSSIGQHPKGGGRWIAGVSNQWQTVTLGLNDLTPHFLIAGFTGSGKTEAIRSAVVQLSRDPDNRLILIDGKAGDGLYPLAHLPGVMAPLAVETDVARAALAWAVSEMMKRYERKNRGESLSDRLIIVADEIQAFTGDKTGDPVISGLLRSLVTQGRGAKVHVLLGTQHPTMEAFNDGLVRRNLVGRIALKTEDFTASSVVVGGEQPRADKLLGMGDAFAIVPGKIERVQMAYIRSHEMSSLPDGQYELEDWPEYSAESAGLFDGQPFSPQEVGLALGAVSEGAGRLRVQDALLAAGLPRPGSGRTDKLMRFARTVRETLEDSCYQINRSEGDPDCLTDQRDAVPPAGREKAGSQAERGTGNKTVRQGKQYRSGRVGYKMMRKDQNDGDDYPYAETD